MRVTFLTHYFPPEVGAPQARIWALARGLTERGIDVTVHAPPPHYPSGQISAPYDNRLLRREAGDRIRVVRSAVYAAPNRGFAARLANHLSFCASALSTAAATGPADVVVVESPPLFTAAAGVLYAKTKRAPLVVNVADRWPASAVELGALEDERAIALAEALERWIYRHAAVVSVPTAGLLDDLRTVPAAAGRVERLSPAVDLDRFNAPPLDPAASGPLRVVYAGTVGMAQGIPTLVEAAHAAGPAVVQVRIVGDGAESDDVRARISDLGATNVTMTGTVASADVPALYAAADCGVVLLRDRPIFEGALPTKMLEVMASGRAVVLSGRGESAALVRDADAGVVVAPEDPAALAEAFRRLAADRVEVARLGASGRAAAAGFARPAAVDRWERTLRRVAGG